MDELTLPLLPDDKEGREKVCFVCGVSKPLDDFDKHPQMADGHINKCKDCRKAYSRTRYADPVIGNQLKSQAAARRAANPDRGRVGRQEASRRFSKSPKGREARQRRRLDEQAAKLGYEVVNLQHVLDRDGPVCHICIALDKSAEDAAIDPRYVTFDHIIPIVKPHYGPHTLENLAPAHKRCNSWKRDRLMEELGGLEPPGAIPVDELLMRFRREAQSRSLKEYYANRDQWTDEQTAAWDERNRRLSEAMQGNQNGVGSPGRKGQPWTDEEREAHLAAVALMIEGGEWQAKLKVGQQIRRAAEKAGERPMFSEEGLKQSLANFAMSWTGEGHDKAVAKSAEVRRDRVKDVANEMWAARAAKGLSGSCAECGGTDSKPIAKGLCTTCYMRKPKPPKPEDGSKRRPGTPKLTEEIVRIIRAEWAYGKSRELAERFGVSVSLIQDVANGKRWSHVA